MFEEDSFSNSQILAVVSNTISAVIPNTIRAVGPEDAPVATTAIDLFVRPVDIDRILLAKGILSEQ